MFKNRNLITYTFMQTPHTYGFNRENNTEANKPSLYTFSYEGYGYFTAPGFG